MLIFKFLKLKYIRFWRFVISFYYRYSLTNKNFTIISNNCWGGFIYQKYNLPYKTPFLGLFIPAPCYIKLLENFDKIMDTSIDFISEGKYPCSNGKKYPIGILGEDIEIHFLHYKTPEEALTKWNQRKLRINKNNMLVKFSEIDFCTPDLIERFDKLPFKNKLCITVNQYKHLKSVITFPAAHNKTETFEEWKYKIPNFTTLINNLDKK
ncbi:MAG: DUF1919 domain-containing protein [Endomicrobiaceae bacterium]|nr:DUF1919 domain-containing protein [Endomicrobiaceae bacterium]